MPPSGSMSVDWRRGGQPEAAIGIKLPSRCVLTAGETDVAIWAHQEYAVRPTEDCLKSLAGRFRKRRQLDNANEVAPRLHGVVQIGRGPRRICETHDQEREPGPTGQADK